MLDILLKRPRARVKCRQSPDHELVMKFIGDVVV